MGEVEAIKKQFSVIANLTHLEAKVGLDWE